MDIDEPVNIENKSRNDPLYRVITSDRMTRDVEILMNSSYWVEALKKKNAVGISEDLNCNYEDKHVILLLLNN